MKINTATLVLSMLLTAGALFAITAPAISAGKVSKMTKETLKGMLENPDLVILDVRSGRDWSSSEFKIQGAHRADPGAIADWAGKYPPDKTIVLYCA